MLFVGDSEVRWGFDPAPIEAALAKEGIDSPKIFNLAIDGFSGKYFRDLLPYFDFSVRAPQLKVVLIGLQLIEDYDKSRSDTLLDCSGALQGPIFNSSFGRDLGIDRLCRDNQGGFGRPLANTAQRWLRTFRYREAIRASILHLVSHGSEAIPFDSGALEWHHNGFHPHKSIIEHRRNYEEGLAGLYRDRQTYPKSFKPLDSSAWRSGLAGGGLAQWASFFCDRGILPVFVALPTNPRLIDLKERRATYEANSAAVKDWTRSNCADFIDLGIMDNLDPEQDYADHRHLSRYGAEKFSRSLAAALAADSRVVAAMKRGPAEAPSPTR